MASAAITPVSELRPFLKNVNCEVEFQLIIQVIVLQMEETKAVKDGQVYQFLVADSSACIILSLWNEYGKLLNPGDIIRLTGGYATLFKNSLRLYASKHGKVQRIGSISTFHSQISQ